MPITNSSLVTLHYSTPAAEVIPSGQKAFDIANLEDDMLNYDVNLEIRETTKLSISFDIQKIGEAEALNVMKLTKFYLDDPEMLLL